MRSRAQPLALSMAGEKYVDLGLGVYTARQSEGWTVSLRFSTVIFVFLKIKRNIMFGVIPTTILTSSRLGLHGARFQAHDLR